MYKWFCRLGFILFFFDFNWKKEEEEEEVKWYIKFNYFGFSWMMGGFLLINDSISLIDLGWNFNYLLM